MENHRGATQISTANPLVRLSAVVNHIANMLQAHRKDLLEIMTSFIPAETVQFNKRLSEVEQHPDKVVMKFEDGSSAEASVLAGADGIKSVTRSHVLQPYPSQVAPVYADAYCYRAVIPIDEAQEIMGDLTDVAKFFFGHNRGAISYRITSGKVSRIIAKSHGIY